MTKNIVFAVAVAVASQACISDEPEGTADRESELGLPGSGANGNHFYYAAYSKKPYIYMGCPDPGPEPVWSQNPQLLAKKGMRTIELELGTAVALEVRAKAMPKGVEFRANDRGGTFSIPEASGKVPLTLAVTHRACTFEVNVEVAYQ